MAHFACHAVAGKLSDDSYLQLADGFRLRLLDMRVDRCTLPGSPLVVLTACGTRVRDPLRTSDFVREFLLSGGRGVVATECDVPDLFAAVFVKVVFDRLLRGEPVSGALLLARWTFLRTHGNPLGLL